MYHSGVTATSISAQRNQQNRTSASTFLSSFRREPKNYASAAVTSTSDGRAFNAKGAASNTARSPLARRLKGRHLQMIAIGGSIGTGLFIGTGQALATGGPASILIAYILIGFVLFCTVQALGEMSVLFPVAGSFAAFSTRFIDPAWGFAMGWDYALQYLCVLPLEIMAATFTLDYWSSPIPKAVCVAVFMVSIIIINLNGVKAFGEAEFLMSVMKVVAVIGFILLGIIINCAGNQDTGYIGGLYWQDPGAFNNGFKGFCNVLVLASFAFAGTELVGLAAAETLNPAKSIPTAVKQVFWRIFLFYILSIIVIGILVPYDSPSLIRGFDVNSKASPFVIAIQNAGIGGMDSIMNGVILISVLSVANSSLWSASRTLAALGEQGQAPRILAYIDREGRPVVAIGIVSLMGFLAFLANSDARGEVFNWLLALSGLSSILTWFSICLCHVRFRKAWTLQGHSLDELVYVSPTGVIGSMIGMVLLVFVLAAQLWVAIDPTGPPSTTWQQTLTNFFSAYLTVPVVLILFAFYKLFYRTSWVKIADVDLKTGKNEFEPALLHVNTREERESWPMWKVFYRTMC